MLEYINISNFRCYEHLYMAFRPKINLFIGDNGSGKTSLLKACRYAMGAWFVGYSDEYTKVESPKNSDFTHQMVKGALLPYHDIRIKFKYRKDVLSPISFIAANKEYTCNHELWIGKNSKKNSRMLVSGIRELRDYGKILRQTNLQIDNNGEVMQTNVHPLFAVFSTEDIHAHLKIESGIFKDYNPSSSFGYYRCLNADGLFPYWMTRMLVLKEADMESFELDIVVTAIKSVLGQNGCNIIQDVHIRPMKREVFFSYTDGRLIASSLLSDGYKRLISIVTDLAFRCALLNGNYVNKNVLALTPGVVLIDEIDQHLHPELQSVILRALGNTFKSLQFIVSTHAPMVMTGVESNADNIVYKLNYSETDGYTRNEVSTYGLDASTILEVCLNMQSRAQEVEMQLKQLYDMIDDNQLVEARGLLSKMRASFNDRLPELNRAETLITMMQND